MIRYGIIRMLLVLGLCFVPKQSILACAVCFSAPGTTVTLAMGNAIVFLLMVVGAVLLGLIVFFGYIAFKAKKFREHQALLGEEGLKNA